MPVQISILPRLYKDSVSLMQTSALVLQNNGIKQVSIVMGSAANIDLLREAGLITHSALNAGPNDVIIAVEGDDDDTAHKAIEQAIELLKQSANLSSDSDDSDEVKVSTLNMAYTKQGDANLAVIATPGDYAASEALKAINLGLNVMIFSDNVSAADERYIKECALKKDVIVMGPDCGTAIINGVPLAFANEVKRGAVGVVGASGTGIQQITSLIDNLGGGISHAIGTGGHDVSLAVGGISMLQGIRLLASDEQTKVIVIVSKPPHPEVCKAVVAEAKTCGKPVVINFIGPEWNAFSSENITFVRTLEDAAVAALAHLPGNFASVDSLDIFQHPKNISNASDTIASGRKWVRGVFTGGTFCYEATYLLGNALSKIKSNTPIESEQAIQNPWESVGHTLIDMGDDVFTRGKPHPMIDPTLRLERLKKEIMDPETAIILFDVVLGYGAHSNPAMELAKIISDSRSCQSGNCGGPLFIGFVCGTQDDLQQLQKQQEVLINAGVILTATNARAVEMVLKFKNNLSS